MWKTLRAKMASHIPVPPWASLLNGTGCALDIAPYRPTSGADADMDALWHDCRAIGTDLTDVLADTTHHGFMHER